MLKTFILKTLLVLIGSLFIAGRGFSQTHKTLMWKISGKGLSKPSYLYGTMHEVCAEDENLSENLQKAIASCDEVYFEIDMSDMAAMAIKAMHAMTMQDGKRLSDLLDSADYQKVRQYFAAHAAMLPFGMVERFKPMLLSSVLEEQDMNCSATDGIELMIMREAKRYDKKLDGLETAEFQAGLFDSIPYEEQAKELVKYIDSAGTRKIRIKELAQIYKAQDLDKIDSLTRSDDGEEGKYLDLLLYGRNRKWARNLQTLLPGKSLLIAVGAAHLPGDQGVINLLKKEGYRVEPMKN